ncbi:MAG: hypothetical protein JSS11_18095 [Verrucomicrobia bacterium]|nr:hypothetical protein [Verrucomicrobiota bacterium]
MKYLLSVALLFIASVAVHAQQQEEDEIITDFGTDDYIYVPKMTLNIGMRSMSGPKASFYGSGTVGSILDFGPAAGTYNRNYHDGYVYQDSRQITDANGNPTPVAPDGKSNTWGYLDSNQLQPGGLIAMNSYSAQITDSSVRSKDTGNSYGVELTVTRDMGQVFNTRLRWGIVGGVSMNDLSASTHDSVSATITRTTDLYSLDGAVPPAAPYTGPTAVTSPVLDANGNQRYDASGNALTQTVDSSVLIDNQPLKRTTTTQTSSTSVMNNWKLKGAYMTFRVGPSLYFPFGEHFNASISAGGVLVYAGTTYTVTQTYKPDTSDDIVDIVGDGVSEFLPGYYVDANLNYIMNEATGLYLGAVYQSSGGYTQRIFNKTSEYFTRVDLSRMQGVRAGLSYKF